MFLPSGDCPLTGGGNGVARARDTKENRFGWEGLADSAAQSHVTGVSLKRLQRATRHLGR